MANSADPDQLASSEANCSGSTLFDKTGHVIFSKRRVQTRNLPNGYAMTASDVRETELNVQTRHCSVKS